MDSLIHSKKELFSLWSTQLLFALVTTVLGVVCTWTVSKTLNYSCENGVGIWIGLFGGIVTCVGLVSLKKSLEIKRKLFFYSYIVLCITDIICCAVLIHISGKCFKYWSAVSHYHGSEAAEVVSWLNMALLFVCLIHAMCCVFSFIILLWDCCCWCKWNEQDVKSEINDDQEL